MIQPKEAFWSKRPSEVPYRDGPILPIQQPELSMHSIRLKGVASTQKISITAEHCTVFGGIQLFG